MKVEEIKREIEKLSQEEKQRLMRELMPGLCQEMMGGGGFKEGMISRCMEMMKESSVQEMMQMMMGQKKAESK